MALAALTSAALGLAAAPVAAGIASLNAGDSVLFDFDFSGQTPALPYDRPGQINFNLVPSSPGTDRAVIHWYAELGGQGALIGERITGGGITLTMNDLTLTDVDAVLDGKFSVSIDVTIGHFELNALKANQCTSLIGCTALIDGVLVRLDQAAQAPEPGSLACAALGLAVLAGRGRRRAQPGRGPGR